MSDDFLKSTLSPTTDLHSKPNNFMNLGNSSINVVVAGGKVVPCLLLVICFMVGLPINVAVVIDICRKYKRYASKVNPNILLLVLNLALVDSVTLSASPFIAYTLFWGFTFGDASCKVYYYIVSTCLFMSVVTVTGISTTYFLIVKFPVANPKMMAQVSRSRRKGLLLGGVWAGALLLSISSLFTRRVVTRRGLLRCSRKTSNETEKLAVLFLETVVGFVLPFLILLTSYVCLYRNTAQRAMSATSREQRKKLNHFVVSVLVTFLICWTPYHIVNMVDVSAIFLLVSSPAVYDRLKVFRHAAGDSMKSFCVLNSVINPFLYAFTLHRKLNKSDASSKQQVTTDMTVDMTIVSQSQQ